MYQIYCIAYRISDEMARQKAEEKPFWWEHLHAEVREKPLEEIEKMLLEAGVPKETVDAMDRKEKYLAVSEGCYAIDCEEYEKKLSGLEKTSFLNQPKNTAQSDTGNPGNPASTPTLSNGGNIEPLSMDTPPTEEDIKTPPPMSAGADDIDDDLIKTHAGAISDDELDDDDDDFLKKKMSSSPPASPFEQKITGGSGMSASGNNSVEIRKMAQSIVRETVSKINNKADAVPETISPQAEQDLLKAVIDELQSLR